VGQYTEVAGIKTWYEDLGSGEPLLLMHGGLSDASSFAPNAPQLAESFHVYMPERRGHGHTPDVDGPISYAAMADDTIGFLETVVGGPAHLAGHSDGANVALLAALRRPDLVRRLVLISGNFHHDGLTPGAIEIEQVAGFLEDSYARVSPDGREHFPVFVAKIARMVAEEPILSTADLARVRNRTLVMAGDDDVIKLSHTCALYENIPDAELAIVPGTSHTLTLEKPALVNQLILDFLSTDPVPTLIPVRRRGVGLPAIAPHPPRRA
jgi:pimeloyl-ACP methyl ester carboxylesterase